MVQSAHALSLTRKSIALCNHAFSTNQSISQSRIIASRVVRDSHAKSINPIQSHPPEYVPKNSDKSFMRVECRTLPPPKKRLSCRAPNTIRNVPAPCRATIAIQTRQPDAKVVCWRNHTRWSLCTRTPLTASRRPRKDRRLRQRSTRRGAQQRQGRWGPGESPSLSQWQWQWRSKRG